MKFINLTNGFDQQIPKYSKALEKQIKNKPKSIL